MRLVMLGTGPFAVPTLRALATSRHEVLLVVTRPPQGRRPEPSPIHQAAETLNLPLWVPDTVNCTKAQKRLEALAADLLVVCDYGEILKPATLTTTRLGGINLHGSLLPKYRGAAPVQWAILRGEVETGNSVIQMTPGLDAGPCLGQQRTVIDPDEDAGQLEARLAVMGAELALRVLDDLAADTAQPIEQDARLASKAPCLKKEQGRIDWSCTAQEIKNLVRGLRPWPRGFTFWHRPDGKPLRLNIDRVRLADLPTGGGEVDRSAAAGTIIESAGQLLIATGSGGIEALELQPAGKRSMGAGEFLRGYPVRRGDRFGPE